MKSLGPYFQFYIDDFDGGTSYFSDRQVGAYVRLLIQQWRDGELPDDDAILIKIARTKLRKTSLEWKQVRCKFKPCGEGVCRNERMHATRLERESFIANQRAKGLKSAANRGSTVVQPWGQPKGQPEVNLSSPSPSPIMIEREREPLTSGSISDCTKAILSARPDMRLREMDVASVLTSCPSDGDRLRIVTDWIADVSNMVDPPNNPIGYLRGYIRKANQPSKQSQEQPAWVRKKAAEAEISRLRSKGNYPSDEDAARMRELRKMIQKLDEESIRSTEGRGDQS